ncbi:MAG: hypothetical protein WDZ59_00595 [Pirellulales bacterium]
MDQLRSIMKTLGRQHFWILCGLVVVLCLVGWWMASGTLVEQYEANSSTVNSRFTAVQSIVSEQQHPNDRITQRVQELTAAQREQVLALWQALYDRQTREVLQWPEEMGDDFLNYIDDIEPESTIQYQFLERYQDRVKERFQQFHKIVDAQPPNSDGADLQSQPTNRFSAYKVHWEDHDQIAAKFVWVDRPNSLKVWITQEDLWVYETLLRIIRNVNQNATGSHNAPIKVISALKVGTEAIEGSDTQGRIYRKSLPDDQASLAQSVAAAPRATSDAAVDEATALKNNRYLDAQWQPLPASQAGEGIEFKRLPVRMELTMEKLDLPELLVECANAPLPVEVRQVRINREQNTGGTRDWAPPAPGSGPNSQGEENVGWVDSPSIGTVIVHGVIYIYKEPDLAALGFSEEEIAQRQNEGQPAPAGTSAG